jgi:hypothetical protein
LASNTSILRSCLERFTRSASTTGTSFNPTSSRPAIVNVRSGFDPRNLADLWRKRRNPSTPSSSAPRRSDLRPQNLFNSRPEEEITKDKAHELSAQSVQNLGKQYGLQE